MKIVLWSGRPEILKTTERIGLQELLRISDVDPTTISEETLGFKLVLNSMPWDA